ncbi:MAG: hypothetical protein IJQ71_12755 [Clostridia bacterium]|nr:hypothetical protein [Clostridia bacterium]
MFNSKEKEFELRIEHLKESMDKLAEDKKGVEKDLEKARAKIAELEEKLAQSEVETLKKKTQETLAEYRSLKEQYQQKIQEFDSSLQEKEENYAMEAVRARGQFEEDIAQGKQDTEKYVAENVETFTETFNYYLEQIKALVDALGHVASASGRQLFSGEEADRKTEFGCRMISALKEETEALPQGDGNRILFASPEEEEAKQEEPGDKPEEAGEAPKEEAADGEAKKAEKKAGKKSGDKKKKEKKKAQQADE